MLQIVIAATIAHKELFMRVQIFYPVDGLIIPLIMKRKKKLIWNKKIQTYFLSIFHLFNTESSFKFLSEGYRAFLLF